MDDLSASERVRASIRGYGLRPLARDTARGHMMVAGWARAGRIPPKHWRAVNDALAAAGREPIPEDVLRRAHEETGP